MILVTGSEGLIGQAVTERLSARGLEVRHFDIKRHPSEDICSPESLEKALDGVTGVLHLAAVTRVVWAENDPELCRRTNVDSIRSLVRLCLAQKTRPWLISASSREVYGQASAFPVHEDSEKRPMNVYARSKAEGERIVEDARENGLVANVCRFANVYGSAKDHSDRVVPAFANAAAFGGVIRVEGPGNAFDFTFVDDVANGLERLVMATGEGKCLPPVHFVSGTATSLGDLADLARTHAQAPVSVQVSEPRTFDVSSFVGDPGRAHELLGWRSSTSLEVGFQKLLERQLAAKASSTCSEKVQCTFPK